MSIILETHDLARYFGGLKAVDGVSLQITEGHLHSIIGPNGAGKTTLFNLLSSTLKPTRGRVVYRGEDITGVSPHEIARRGISRSYQVTNIFPNLTVLENVRLAAQALGDDSYRLFASADRFAGYIEKAMQALEETGLKDDQHTLALNLPHGGKRKLELAMLLAQDSQLLLLDEPTAGLASEQVPEFMALVDAIRQSGGKTVVLVEHNMGVVMSLSDRISVMHHGQLLAEGTPNEIAENETVQKAYLGELYGDFSEVIVGGEAS